MNVISTPLRRGQRGRGHHALVQLLHLSPGSRHRPLLPAAISAHGGAAEKDAVVGLAKYREPLRRAATTAGERAEAVRGSLPERAVRRFELLPDLRVHF